MTDRSDKSKNDIFNLNISNNNNFIIKDLNDSKNINKKNSDDELDKTVKINNILEQMKIMGYNKDYVLDCVKRNELCHASAVYYLMMNYENI